IRDRTVTGVQTCALPIYDGYADNISLVFNPVKVVAANLKAAITTTISNARSLYKFRLSGKVVLFDPNFVTITDGGPPTPGSGYTDRKSTRLNSSHRTISY